MYTLPTLVDIQDVTSISAGNVHSVLLTSGGVIMTAGRVDGNEALGLGRAVDVDEQGFVAVTEVLASESDLIPDSDLFNATSYTSPPKFAKVFASRYYTVAIDEEGNVWSTGSNYYGQLCLGDDVDRDRFAMVNFESFKESVDVFETGMSTAVPASNFSNVLLETGMSTAVPNGDFSTDLPEIGPSTAIDESARKTMETSGNSTRIIDVALGERHTLLLREDGKLYSCGWNQYGQLGLENGNGASNVLYPKQVVLHETVTEIAAGRGSSYFLTESKNVYVAGTNYDGQLCLGDREDRNTPTLMDPFQKDDGLDGSKREVQAVTAGKSSLYLLLSDGQVFACGENTHGQLGLGDLNSTSVDVPTLIPLQDVVSIFSGPTSFSAFFVHGNGTVHSVGYNGGGELGVGDEINRDTPTVVACSDETSTTDEDLASRILISAGNDHTLFIGSESTFLCSNETDATKEDGSTSSPTITASPTVTKVPTTSPTVTASPTITSMPTTPTASPSADKNNVTYIPTMISNTTIDGNKDADSSCGEQFGYSSLILCLLYSIVGLCIF
jgi:alpha-tubulin suppressor-like RCC1 family protein